MIKRPMKGAAVDDLSQIQLPCIASPKIDGFRCILGERPLTSRLGPYRNPFLNSELEGLLDEHLLDGEIVVGRRRGKGVLQRTSSGLTNGEGEPDFTLWVFDAPRPDCGFQDRLRIAEQLVRDIDHPRVRFLRHRAIDTLPSLREFLERCLARGYEGIITRSPGGLYKEGKSTLRQQGMLKVKPFEDFEARITGYYEEMENTNEAKRETTGKLKRSSAKAGKRPKGTLGGFIGRTLKGNVEVRVGGGFTAAERKRFWAIKDELVETGAIMKCKKQKVGEKDKPRHPNFICLRPEWDITD